MPKTLWCWPLAVWFHCTRSHGSSRYHIWWLLLNHHPYNTQYLLQDCTPWRSYSLYCNPLYEFQYLLFLHKLFHNGRNRTDSSSLNVPCHSFPNYRKKSTTSTGFHYEKWFKYTKVYHVWDNTGLSKKTKKSNKVMSTNLSTKFLRSLNLSFYYPRSWQMRDYRWKR